MSILQIIITKDPDGEYKVAAMDAKEVLETEKCEKGAVLPIVAALLLLLVAPAQGQHNHAAGHDDYKNWVNKEGVNCCHNQDCGELKDEDERTVGGSLEVRIEGTWCPVHPNHYLKAGKSPDWTTSHVCVRKSVSWQVIPPCSRLLCYQPKPGT